MTKYAKKLEEGKKFLYEKDNIRYYKNDTWINVKDIPRNNKNFEWGKCNNIILPFHCIDIDGIITIEYSYKTKDEWRLSLKYNEKIFTVKPFYFMNNSGIQNIIFEHGVFVFSIGQILKDEKYNLTIVDRKYNKKTYPNTKTEYKHMYKVHCNNCGREYWTTLYQLEYGKGCKFCTGFMHSQIIEGYNDIPTTASWMIPYFKGGYNEAKLYSHASKKEIYPICPYCNTISNKPYRIGVIYQQHGFSCKCNDKMYYPEKIMTNILDQLDINYKSHIGAGTFQWAKGVIYDFYIEDKSCIIETHGWQHYENTTFSFKGGRTLAEEQENDGLKERLAKENGIKNYIIVDCRLSKLDYIKNSVINSNLPKILNFNENDIDWTQCETFALDNLTLSICNYYNNISTDISNISCYFHKEITFIKNALLRGNTCGLCNYKQYLKVGIGNCKPIKCVENNKEYLSSSDCSKLSEIDFGVKLVHTKICESAKNNTSYKGFHFVYIDKNDYFERHGLYKTK